MLGGAGRVMMVGSAAFLSHQSQLPINVIPNRPQGVARTSRGEWLSTPKRPIMWGFRWPVSRTNWRASR